MPTKPKIGIRRKIAWFFIAYAFILLGVTLAMVYLGEYNLRRATIGEEHVGIAQRISGTIGEMINTRIDGIKSHLSSRMWKDALREANIKYAAMSEAQIKDYLLGMDKEWIPAPEDAPVIKQYLDTPMSLRLHDLAEVDIDIAEIFLTDKFGGLAAASEKTSDFYQSDEDWWQKAYDFGKGSIFIGEVELDASSNKLSIPIAVPVRDADGSIIGICKESVDIDSFFSPLERVKIGNTGHAVLLNGKGEIIFHSAVKSFSGKVFSGENFEQLLKSGRNWQIIGSESSLHKEKMLVAVAQIENPFLLKRGIIWWVVVEISAAEVFAPLSVLLWQLGILLGILISLLLPTAFIFSGIFVRPIKKLRESAESIAAGCLDCEIKIKTGDEIEQLADSFRKMAVNIKEKQLGLEKSKSEIEEWSKTLEEKVRARTEDLNLAQQATLNILEDLEQAKNILAADKLRVDSLIESMSEGVVMLEEKGGLMIINPQARQMLDFARDEEITSTVLGEKLKAIGLSGAIEECRFTKVFVSKEILFPRKESQILRADISIVENTEKRVIGILLVLRDITKEKELDQFKNELVSMVSHELRTPLSITKEGISLVLDKVFGEIKPRQEEVLTMAMNNINRLTRIINNLLDISKIESGKIELKREKVNIGSVITQVASAFALKVKEKGLELKVNFPAQDIELYADTDKLVQIFTNLVSNALKFTREGSIEISARKENGNLECAVIDTGIGISKDDLPSVFNKFQQFNRPAGAGEKGTGLGLSIAKGLVQLHKGKIWVESSLGRGARFIFSLPVYSFEMALKDRIKDAVSAAQINNSKVSLIVVSLLNFDKIKSGAPGDPAAAAAKEIKLIFEKALRQKSDIVIKDIHGIFIILPEYGKENSLVVQGRLEQALGDYLSAKGLREGSDPRFSCLTYPDDAASAGELFDKIISGGIK